MKIAVVGCGAVGSYYGAKLARSGLDVSFLLRSDYEAVRRQGVRVRSPQGDFVVHPRPAKSPREIGPCDLVLIGLKTTANARFRTLIPPLIKRSTRVVTLQNGLGNEEQLKKWVPAGQVLGGLCFVCLNRLSPGLVQHIAHGLVVLGRFQRPRDGRTEEIARLFVQAGVPCTVTDDLARAHWEKLIWNIPFNGLGVAGAAGYEAVERGKRSPGAAIGPCLSTDILLADKKWEQLVRELMLEVIAAARALGHDVDVSLAEEQIRRTRTMGAYRASTLIDFEREQPLELESLFLEPLRQAQRAGVEVPRLSGLCKVLVSLDAGRTARTRA